LLRAVVDARTQKDFSDASAVLREQYEQVYQHFVDKWLPYEEEFALYKFAGVRTLFNAANNPLEWYGRYELEWQYFTNS